MAGEVIYAFGTTKVLEAAGAQSTNATITKADDASYDVVADGAGFPDALFALTVTCATAPGESMPVNLYARVLSVDGTNDADVPEVARPGRYIGQFNLNNVTVLQAIELAAYDLPRKAEYYLHNASGVTINAGWALRVTPRSYKLAG